MKETNPASSQSTVYSSTIITECHAAVTGGLVEALCVPPYKRSTRKGQVVGERAPF